MRRSRVVAIAALSIVLASVMVLSPLGSPLAADLKTDVGSGLEIVGAAFGAMFPHAVMIGPIPQSENLRVGVNLPLQNQDELNSFVEAASTPGSAQFRQFITPAEFDAAYAPSESSYLQMESYFEGYELHMEISSNRLVLGVTGNPTQMGAAFHTSFADFRFPQGDTYYGTTSAPQVPLSLGISGAFGFSNALFNKPAFVSNSLPAGKNGDIPLSCSKGDTPAQIESAYGVSTLLGAGDNGTGEKIGIVDDYDMTDPQTTLASDISTFDSDCSLQAANVVYNYPVLSTTYNSSSADNGDGTETDLDMQMSHLMAPAATIDVTFSPDDGNGLYQALDSLVAGDIVNDITISWGESDFGNDNGGSCSYECNASTDGSYAIVHPMMEAAAAEGISVFVASGDCGAADGTTTTTTDYPSSDEDVTGVGGTVLNLTGSNYKSEWAWSGNESNCPNNDGGAGGGWAPTPQPWYQHGYGIPHKTLRGVPDVGITAGTALEAVEDGSQVGDYGTSDAAPMWAGLTAIADQIHGGDVGLLNPILYSILRSGANYNSSFHDITTGYNGYKAGPGWDPITGVGTPIANVAIPEIANGGPPTPQTGLTATLTPSTTTPVAKASVTFTAVATGGTGMYPKYTFNFGDGNSTTTSKTTATHAYTSDGAYAANVEAYDSGSNSTASPFVQMSVGTTPFTVALSVNVTATTVGSQVKFTAAASGGSPSYSFEYYFGDGSNSPMLMTTTTFIHAYYAAGVFGAQVTATDSNNPADGATSNVLAITVTAPSTSTLSSVAVAPTSPTVGSSSATPFTAVPTCSAICPGGITYAWALSSTALGTLSGSGSSVTFNSGTTAGTVGIFVNATLNGITKGTSTIITVSAAPATLSSVAVNPPNPTVPASGSQPFAAIPTCSVTCPGTITYVWAVTSSTLGTLTGSGASATLNAGPSAVTGGIFVNATLGATTKEASTTITITLVSLNSVTLSPTTPTVPASGTQPFTVTPACSATCPGSITYAWALSSTNLGPLSGSGSTNTFTAGTTAGTVGLFVNATLGGTTKGTSTIITVSPRVATLTSLAVSPTAPSVPSGTQQIFTATPTCSVTCPGTGITYTWTVTSATLGSVSGTGASGTFTAGTTAVTGGIFVNATLGASTQEASAVITVTVTVTLSSVSVSPPTATVAATNSQTFTATPTCSATCPLSGITYSWSISNTGMGSISGTGASESFTAGSTAGTLGIFVNATLSGTTETASAEITVTAPVVTLSSVAVGPTAPSVAAGKTQLFTATPTCSGNCPATITYTWALSKTTLGSLSGSGATDTFSAGNTAGTVGIYVNATLSGTTKTASTVITVTSSVATLSQVSLSPVSINMTTGGQQTFTASITCLSGSSVASCPSGAAYTWALSNGDGNVSSSGASSTSASFTAGNTAGSELLTVTATLNGIHVTASAAIIITSSGSGTSGFLSGTMLLLVIVAAIAVVAVVAVVLLLRRKPKPVESQPPSPWDGQPMYSNQPPAEYSPPPQDPSGGVSTGYGYVPPSQ